MNVCKTCGYKVVSNAMFEKHLKIHDVIPVSMESPTIVENAKPVEKPIVFHASEITLKFTKPVEVYINGKAYLGKEMVVKDMSLASEIVRIAREHYGSSILV